MIAKFGGYKKAFNYALFLHGCVILLLVLEPHHARPVLVQETRNEAGQMTPDVDLASVQPVKAVNIEQKDVMQAVEKLKQERLHQQQVERQHQRRLQQQAEQARQQRLQEQQRIARLKSEAEKLALERKQNLLQEQKRLKELAEQKKVQEAHLAAMKLQQQALEKQQQLEAKKLEDLKKKKAEELARAEQLKNEKAKAELAQKQKAAAQQAALDAAKAARLAGEVDKYKAMIINAISRQWILPENVDSSLSSQFRIRLAPNGAVLNVSLVRSSGDPVLDRSAQAAIYKASPLPVPSDTTTFNLFRDISLTVRPMSARG